MDEATGALISGTEPTAFRLNNAIQNQRLHHDHQKLAMRCLADGRHVGNGWLQIEGVVSADVASRSGNSDERG